MSCSKSQTKPAGEAGLGPKSLASAHRVCAELPTEEAWTAGERVHDKATAETWLWHLSALWPAYRYFINEEHQAQSR